MEFTEPSLQQGWCKTGCLSLPPAKVWVSSGMYIHSFLGSSLLTFRIKVIFFIQPEFLAFPLVPVGLSLLPEQVSSVSHSEPFCTDTLVSIRCVPFLLSSHQSSKSIPWSQELQPCLQHQLWPAFILAQAFPCFLEGLRRSPSPHLHLLPPSSFPGHCVAWGLTLTQMHWSI